MPVTNVLNNPKQAFRLVTLKAQQRYHGLVDKMPSSCIWNPVPILTKVSLFLEHGQANTSSRNLFFIFVLMSLFFKLVSGFKVCSAQALTSGLFVQMLFPFYVSWVKICIETFCIELCRLRKGSGPLLLGT